MTITKMKVKNKKMQLANQFLIMDPDTFRIFFEYKYIMTYPQNNIT